MNKALSYIIFFFIMCSISACKLHHFDDTITLGSHDKIPYGTYAAYKLLSKEFPHALIQTNKYSPSDWKNLSSDSDKQILFIVTKTFDPTEDDLAVIGSMGWGSRTH